MKNSFLLLLLTSFLVACSAKKPDFEKQALASRMAEQGIYYYWNGGDLSKVEKEFFKGITLKGNLDAVASFFEEARELDPFFLPYQFSLASTKVIQGKVSEALSVYDQILEQDPSNFEAALLKLTYSHYKDSSQLLALLPALSALNEEKARLYQEKFEQAVKLISIPISFTANRSFSDLQDSEHAVVVLGYALAKDGSMKKPLIGRLEQALALHSFYPLSPIIVSGGVPQNGVTESYQMKKWLVEKGVEESLVWIEDQAKDTVGNALFSSQLLSRIPNLKAVTLVSSASHVRRGLVTLKEASGQEGMNLELSSLAYLDFSSPTEVREPSEKEYLVIFRDLLRTSGISAYPGFQR